MADGCCLICEALILEALAFGGEIFGSAELFRVWNVHVSGEQHRCGGTADAGGRAVVCAGEVRRRSRR